MVVVTTLSDLATARRRGRGPGAPARGRDDGKHRHEPRRSRRGASRDAPWQAVHRPKISRRWAVTRNSDRRPISPSTAARPWSATSRDRPQRGADGVVVVDRVAGDVGVVAARQVDALHEAQRREQVERPEDRRPADVQPAPPGVLDQLGRGEVPVSCGDQPGDGAARLGQPVAGAVERLHDVAPASSTAADRGWTSGRGGHGAPAACPGVGRHAARPSTASMAAPVGRRRASSPRGPNTSATRNAEVWTSTMVAPLATSNQ